MKYNRKNRAIVSGIMVGVASIYAVASYFQVEWSELNSFMLATLLFFASIVLLSAIAIVVLKILGALLRRLRDQSGDEDTNRHE